MRLWITLIPVALCCGIVEPHSGARTLGFAAASQDDLAADSEALEEQSDQLKAVGDFSEEDEDRGDYVTTPPPHTVTVHLPSLPTLPALPALPPLPALPQLPSPLLPPRETITATKTLYVEVTRRITRHPVCMTVYGVKPPCLPVDLHSGHNAAHEPDCWKRDSPPEEESLWGDDLQEGLYIEPTSVLRIPSATAVPAVPQKEEDTPELEPSHKARYLEFRRETPAPPTTASADNARLLNLSPETHTATRTLWVTKVQKVTDYRVTATLEAKNCVPSDLKLPFCQAPPHKPAHYTPTKPPHHVAKPPQYITTNPPYHLTHNEPSGYKPPGPVHWKDTEKEGVSQEEAESDV
ncbi:mucin-2-like isoform X2 [Zootermopsis nevadensis]|uniref:Uncharacterized protein n=2 Tax=Zootermopsis nevadensis TaxID=136037 RepID=A0A067R7H2_ZOONE|nr:mucin-2-like isoform X2 [Zootermopsis nevadensis]XP_021929770.1 mucin-2-like isoform X2 [Zootermopsis nevadensis]KDR14247.1 hypothetical protein L798_10553 [Zootermopsis nevadensis]